MDDVEAAVALDQSLTSLSEIGTPGQQLGVATDGRMARLVAHIGFIGTKIGASEVKMPVVWAETA
ncbi:MAG: hypothetical protein ACIAS6_02980 [Phycisphaerales bacterium JB060]